MLILANVPEVLHNIITKLEEVCEKTVDGIWDENKCGEIKSY